MLMNSLLVYHEAGDYEIKIPRGTRILGNVLVQSDSTILKVRFPTGGNHELEQKKINIFLRHLKEMYQIR